MTDALTIINETDELKRQVAAMVKFSQDPDVKAKIIKIGEYAQNLEVKTSDAYEDGSAKLLVINEFKKEIKNKFASPKGFVAQISKFIRGVETEMDNPLNRARYLIEPKIRHFKNEQERIRQEKEIKLQKEARERQRKLEEKALKGAEKATEKGDPQTAEAILTSVPSVPVPKVQSSIPKVRGVSSRIIWKAKPVDKNKMLHAHLIPNESLLNQIARQTKGKVDMKDYPGWEFYPEEITAVGGR